MQALGVLTPFTTVIVQLRVLETLKRPAEDPFWDPISTISISTLRHHSSLHRPTLRLSLHVAQKAYPQLQHPFSCTMKWLRLQPRQPLARLLLLLFKALDHGHCPAVIRQSSTSSILDVETNSLSIRDSANDHTLSFAASVTGALTVENCVAACQNSGYTFAGVENSSQCCKSFT